MSPCCPARAALWRLASLGDKIVVMTTPDATVPAALRAALKDRYELLSELGRGGMATVYLARDVRHARQVAIKVLHPELAAVLGAERFLAEITTTANLQHPHILPLFDSGSADGQLFYVMPFVEGETLRGRLDRETQLPVADAIRIAGEVADALATAHAAGVVHRDIKPENILLQKGHALVSDFGIALAVQQAGGARMTQTGLSLGTPQYMAPEQAMGDKTVDHRADIYALGAVTYEMLTGEPPHSGASAQAIVAKLLTETVRPVSVVRPNIPAHIDAAVQLALAKLPADRFQSVSEFRDALRDGTGMTAAMTTARTSPATRRSAGRWIGIAVVAASLAGVSGWYAGRQSSTGANASTAPITAQLAFAPAPTPTTGWLAISRDGRMMSFMAPDSSAPNKNKLVFVGLADNHSFVAPEYGPSVSFSPDGSRAAMITAVGALAVIRTDGSGAPEIRKETFAAGSAVTWLTDSSLAVAVRSGSLWIVSPGSGRIDSIPLPSTNSTEGYSQPSAVTPRLLLMRRGIGSAQLPLDIGVVDLDRRNFRSLNARGIRPQYVDPGIVMYVRDDELWGLPVDPKTLVPTGSERRVAAATSNSVVLAFAVSRNGVLIVRRGDRSPRGTRHLVVLDRSGRDISPRTEAGNFRSVRFSPDGSRLLYSNASLNASQGADIFSLSTKDGGLLRLTNDSANLAPEWSHDGRFVYFARLGSRVRAGRDKAEIVRIPAEGGGQPSVLLRRSNQIYELQFTPDESRLLWREDVGPNTRDILSASLASPDSVRGERTTRFDERGIAMSPDGAWYVYTSDETGVSEIYLSRLGDNGARWPVSRGGGTEPRWSRSGEIFFRRFDTVFVARAQLGAEPQVQTPRSLFIDSFLATGHEPLWDVSPDGQRFAVVHDPRLNVSNGTYLELMMNWLPGWQSGASSATRAAR